MKRSEIVEFVRSVPNGRFIGMEWIKSDGSLRKGQVAFGVKNPAHVTPPDKGERKGVSFKEALDNGVLKFFEANAENKDGTKGGYRSARIERIVAITYNGVRHTID